MQTTRVIQNAIRESDLLARIGGEEFALLLPHTAREGALFLAERIIDAIRSSSTSTAEAELQVTLSIGGATCESSRTRLDQLLHRADDQLYQAKLSGRDRYEIEPPDQVTGLSIASDRS